METLTSVISPEKILNLPLIVYGPGLFLVFLFLMRFIRSLFSLHLITAFTSLVYAWLILVLLTHLAPAIVQMYDLGTKEIEEQASIQTPSNNLEQRLS